jgi:membrane protein implicated in regulation of membrane protease activity
MAGWIVWALVACGFAVGEMLTTGFFLAPFAVGGALAAAADAAGAGEAVSWFVFVAVALMTVATVRPLLKSRLIHGPPMRTGGAALVGKQAIVLERIANGEGVGCVKIDGEVWTARALDDEREIEVGQRVEVVDVRGATALVME